jgi:peroxiredoxin
LLLAQESCLVCYLELDRWKQLARWQPRLTLAVIVLGGDTAFTNQVALEQVLPFPLVPDPDSAIAKSLGLQAIAPQRVLLTGGRIALLADGPDEGPTGFAEGLASLLAQSEQ